MAVVTITPESHRRLKIFSAKYNLPMKKVLDWFILTFLDENGEPNILNLEKALEELKAGELTIILNKSHEK